jgi:hypothetical protein
MSSPRCGLICRIWLLAVLANVRFYSTKYWRGVRHISIHACSHAAMQKSILVGPTGRGDWTLWTAKLGFTYTNMSVNCMLTPSLLACYLYLQFRKLCLPASSHADMLTCLHACLRPQMPTNDCNPGPYCRTWLRRDNTAELDSPEAYV